MLKRYNTKSKEGFTIIEVVLVLAVAGLIFLMVFIALPSLQRTQRDTQRRQDYSILSTAVTNYIANNGGKLDKLTGNTGINESLDPKLWINVDGKDPNGYDYELRAYTYGKWSGDGIGKPLGTVKNVTTETCSDTKYNSRQSCEQAGKMWTKTVTAGGPGSQVFIITGANCNNADDQGNSAPDSDNATRAYVIYGFLEGGGTYCQDVGKTI